MRNKRSVWEIATQPFPEAHFATFPEKLVEPCILAGSKEGDTVLDCFAGAGTAGVVALRYGRDFIGIELNPAYVQIARMRIEEDAPLFNKISDQVSGVRCQSTGASGVGGVSEASEVSGARQAELFAEFRCGEARWGF